jgi:hypothetical protein
MNRTEAKFILLLYRQGTEDDHDPHVAEALALAERDPELKEWHVINCARQFVLREKFRQIAVPAGLKEQIISEQAAAEMIVASWRPKIWLAPVAALLVLSGVLASLWFAKPGQNDTLVVFQNQMAGVALRSYEVDLMTNDPVPIYTYFAQNNAPADFILPEALKRAGLVGCAIEGWQGGKVSMVCFRTGRAAPAAASDLWLFVVDRASVKKSGASPAPQFSKVNRLNTATWIQGDKLFFLGTTGDEQTLEKYL